MLAIVKGKPFCKTQCTKKIIYLVIAILFSALQCFSQGDTQQAVAKVERAWLDTYERRDAEAMDNIVAKDFFATFSDGSTQTKQQLINWLRSGSNDPTVKTRFYTEDVQIRIYGNTAILTGTVVTEYNRDGRQEKKRARYTDTYIKNKGQWQPVASHVSNSKTPE